ncbi:hypothetical protein SPI_04256 [Niveomyces insectorum RCEF 264]|uniref:Methyltransferase domain-containing protein n=1 Tax=Niveomyces insectorum RCEF 264 TaxID=1081102 RepID=A0A167VKC3_9HYPO|nr:hypothetical protein SPI_04256 [Niveomyces insectorum RCEF 264]
MSIYTLNHAALPVEIERLEWNHHNLLVPVMGNHLLPPDILAELQAASTTSSSSAATTRPPAVADIGTGTGVWLVDLAAHLPADARLYADALQPFAPALHGQYDLVHVRLLVLALRAGDWAPLAANLLTLLRPGGWLVWEEVDLQHFQAVAVASDPPKAGTEQPPPGPSAASTTAGTNGTSTSTSTSTAVSPPSASTSTPSLAATTIDTMVQFNHSRTEKPSPYPVGLDAVLAAAGFADARQHAFKVADHWDDPALRKATQFAFVTIVGSYLRGMAAAGGFRDIQTADDAAQRTAAVQAELDAGGTRVDYWLWRTTGRKSL